MKKFILIIAVFCFYGSLYAQSQDSSDIVKLKEVIISANRFDINLNENPGAASFVSEHSLSKMPKSVAAEEALRLVPGVRIDNQHDGERVHISIRGQGILTERGLRGIGIMLDGIPVNDPSGFAPDLYDVDWLYVKNIEVLRGPAAAIYGSSAAAGLININTISGGDRPFMGEFSQSLGSHGFYKSGLMFRGSKDDLDYRISFSRTGGNGYRDHQAFWSNKFYEKINYHPTKKLSLTQIISHTDYFHQNPEGLALNQLDNPKQANPDAVPFNEYQKVNRTTLGLNGVYEINKNQNINAYAFLRRWEYKETSNKAAEYRNYNDPGAGIQYNLNLKAGKVNNHFSLGTDLKWQTIKMYKLKSAADENRVESIDETNIETDTLLANQIIFQQSLGVYAFYKMDIGHFNFIANVRYDNIKNELTDKMMGADTAKTNMDFDQTSYRLGMSYSNSNAANLYANYSQGFIPPSTEELASNPLGYSGFNTHLVPATSSSFEIGSRGTIGNRIYYDVCGFIMDTKNDFFRFKQSGRGNQEVFYGNAGNSRRYGIETYFAISLLKKLQLEIAYTYANYQYTSASVDPVYTDTAYVLTTPPAAGQYLPNSPKHQLYAEITYSINKNLKFNIGTEYQSEWAIYTDAKAYNDELDPTIYQNWQQGFNIYNARLSYLWNINKLGGEISLSARNFTGEKYMAFTEPDPDGNAYQPGPEQEFFVNLKVRF